MHKENDTLKFIRHRKLSNYRLYIYKDYMSGKYVLQEEYWHNSKALQSHNITYDSRLAPVVMAYNRAIEEYKLYRGEQV